MWSMENSIHSAAINKNVHNPSQSGVYIQLHHLSFVIYSTEMYTKVSVGVSVNSLHSDTALHGQLVFIPY